MTVGIRKVPTHPLVVIDMQEEFLSEGTNRDLRLKLIQNVAGLVQDAIAHNRHVILVEYAGPGRTVPSILNKLKNYLKLVVVLKSNDGGAPELLYALQEAKIKSKTLDVCGINSTCCVRDTVRGMLRVGYKCRILQAGTADVYSEFATVDASYIRSVRSGIVGLKPDAVSMVFDA